MSAEHWGRKPEDWANLAEPSNEPLFSTVLARLGVGAGTRLLDVGCGSGYAARLAAALGASVTGIDITPELLEIARARVPDADFRPGGMEALPFPDAAFDAVVAFNAFPFADDPERAVDESARVARPGGLVAATTFAEPERNESTALHLALEPLRPAAGGGNCRYSGGFLFDVQGPESRSYLDALCFGRTDAGVLDAYLHDLHEIPGWIEQLGRETVSIAPPPDMFPPVFPGWPHFPGADGVDHRIFALGTACGPVRRRGNCWSGTRPSAGSTCPTGRQRASSRSGTAARSRACASVTTAAMAAARRARSTPRR